jgi:hypothetical protein
MNAIIDIPLDDSSTASETRRTPRDRAYELGRQLQSLAAAQASLDHDFCVLVDQFDAAGAIAHFDGIKSTAHYLAWACSMNATVAREHVRVARALRGMPQVNELFRQARLSYSKVRELTRLADLVDEGELCDLALELTASQLARTVSAYRLASGSRIQALPERRYSSQPTGDGMVRISVVLPAEEAALIDAALEAAARAAAESAVGDQPHLDEPLRHVPRLDRVQALVDVAASYLDTLPGEPADDHTLVLVHVNAEALDVPAGTSIASGTCHVEGHGPIEPATAERLLCTARVQGVLVGQGGKVLNLGRTKRLATRAQRRALKVRDKGICQFSGCHSTSHLDAHHVVHWSHGGPTDLDNLILLCGRHHTLVHEGGLRISPAPAGSARRWDFWMPEGGRVDADGYLAWRDVEDITMILAMRAAASATADPTRIFPSTAGAGFSLHDAVRVLFDITTGQSLHHAA